MISATSHRNDNDVLILAPFGKDSVLIESVLRQSQIQVRVAANAKDLVASIPEDASAAIISEEALEETCIADLAHRVGSQPAWSDFPIIVLTGGGMSTADTEVAVRARAPLGNVALLERPLRAATMISAVRTALAARRRQYEIRDHLLERKQSEEDLRKAHDALETIVEERTQALRLLSTRLLRVQDAERRRIARELHDSLGQYLAAVKINLEMMNLRDGDPDGCLAEVKQLLDLAISETRTLSHLLHPPLLDATGFASAATWYVEGFGKRSGIETIFRFPENLPRLSVNIETALFRIMQEALTNVHRHSGSRRVEIILTTDNTTATLVITDFGKGIPKEILEPLMQSGSNVGVGLSGIRERVKELDGFFEIQSGGQGTTLKVRVPVSDEPENPRGNPASQIYVSLAS
jgi:signal transduction histidine kinase